MTVLFSRFSSALCIQLLWVACLVCARSTITMTGTPGGASPITVTTPWLCFSLNSGGTLGNGKTNPGLQFSVIGDGVYGADIISPGTPSEGFSVSGTILSGTAFTHTNENGAGTAIVMTQWSASVEAAPNEDILHACWTGTTSWYTLLVNYTVRASVPQIKMTTTITVAPGVSIGSLAFLRFVDPDQEGSSATSNLCGYGALFPPKTFVSSLGANGATALALFTSMSARGAIQRINAGNDDWTRSPTHLLDIAPDTSPIAGDKTIGLVFLLGNRSGGQSTTTLTYYYGLARDLSSLLTNGAFSNVGVLLSNTRSHVLTSEVSDSMSASKSSASQIHSESVTNSSIPTITHSQSPQRESSSLTNLTSGTVSHAISTVASATLSSSFSNSESLSHSLAITLSDSRHVSNSSSPTTPMTSSASITATLSPSYTRSDVSLLPSSTESSTISRSNSRASHSRSENSRTPSGSRSLSPSVSRMISPSISRHRSASLNATVGTSVSTSFPASHSSSTTSTDSFVLSASCNPAPVDLNNAFVASEQSNPSVVRARPETPETTEGTVFPSLIVSSGVAESILTVQTQNNSQLTSTTLNFSIHIFSDNAAAGLDISSVLFQARNIALSIQNYGNSTTSSQDSQLTVACAWEGFGSLVTAPFIACRMSNVANAVNRFADVKLQVNLVVGCDHPRSTIPVGLTLLARPIPLEAVAQVVSGTSSATSVLTGNGVAGASAARSSATLRVMSCSNPGADGAGSGGLFSLYLGDGPLAASRGALASTAAVTIAVYVVALGVAFVLSIRSPEVTFRDRCTQLYIPSYPMLIFLIFGPTIISSGMSLVAYDVATPGDISIGVVALVIVALIFLYSLWQVLLVAPKEIYAKPVVDSNSNVIGTPMSRWNIIIMFRRAHKNHHRWALRDNSSSIKGNGVVPMSTSSATRTTSGIVPVIADYRILWFFVFELASNILSGAVAGVPGLDGNSHLSQAVCLVLSSSMLLCNLLQLGVCVALRPTSSIFMQVYTIYVLVLSCAMCASIVAFLVFVDAANDAPAASATKVRYTDHASIAALGTVYFSLLVGASTTVKALIDGWNISCFIWHSCISYRMRSMSPSQDALNHTDDDDPFSALQVDVDDAPFDDGDAIIDVVDLNPTDECGDVFAMDSTSAFSDDPLRELFNYSFIEDRGSDEADP
ncbi:membrane-associated protein, putative [Bodo saltans]|uniref:Membrane-associated protein, putative n=1 Tax=Bodo saltans TaxID=75058 RepID=A0A0S4J2N6_BODSA|nr:membrane-associated protein, putative [Bodo saltans]|eukprot:CUG66967.1 membrane-associated protein, putative [Bodo saltans]